MKRIGLEPGKSLDFKAVPASIQQALQDGATDGLKAVHSRPTCSCKPAIEHWVTTLSALTPSASKSRNARTGFLSRNFDFSGLWFASVL